MINLKNYVCTLEQAKKLKELGIDKDGIFAWVAIENPLFGVYAEDDCKIEDWRIAIKDRHTYGNDWVYNAYTSQELVEMILEIDYIYGFCIEVMKDTGKKFLKVYTKNESQCGYIAKEYIDKCEVSAIAEFLIYLLEVKNV